MQFPVTPWRDSFGSPIADATRVSDGAPLDPCYPSSIAVPCDPPLSGGSFRFWGWPAPAPAPAMAMRALDTCRPRCVAGLMACSSTQNAIACRTFSSRQPWVSRSGATAARWSTFRGACCRGPGRPPSRSCGVSFRRRGVGSVATPASTRARDQGVAAGLVTVRGSAAACARFLLSENPSTSRADRVRDRRWCGWTGPGRARPHRRVRACRGRGSCGCVWQRGGSVRTPAGGR